MQVDHGKQVEELEVDAEVLLKSVPKVNLIPHTIFLLCGPTHSGKSQFSEDLAYLADDKGLNFKILSSDRNRENFLRETSLSHVNRNRYSDSMQMMSGLAFEKLMFDLRIYTSHPVNTDIIVVDTTGMNEVFRQQVLDVANLNAYRVCLVTFDYKFRSSYFPPGVVEYQREIIERSVANFRQKTLPSISAKDYQDRIRITRKSQFGWDLRDQIQVTLENWVDNACTSLADERIALYKQCIGIDNSIEKDSTGEPVGEVVFAVIGDSHEQTDTLAKLISDVETKYPTVRIIHIGDYLGKNNDTERMVNFIYERFSKGDIFVQANHESYVAKRLRKEISKDEKLEASYFTSVSVLENNPELARKFLEVWDSSLPFVALFTWTYDGSAPVIITHAPCQKKYLAKVTDLAIRYQKNYRIVDRTKPMMEELDWLYKEANFNDPLHIFGHVSHNPTSFKGYKYKNKVFLDSGAGSGNFLSAAIVKAGRLVEVLTSEIEGEVREQLPNDLGFGPKRNVPVTLDSFDLDYNDLRLMNHVIRNDVKYISGTMAPAASDPSKLDIESLELGLAYFVEKLGEDKRVVIQPKFMGSRCQLYLFKEKEKTFATSRGGWVIRYVEGKTKEQFQEFLMEEWERRKHLVEKYGDLILDCEIMPWRALGAELVDREFETYQVLIENELSVLENNPYLAAMPDFASYLNVTGKKECLVKFKESLQNYSKPAEVSISAFDILKTEKPIDADMNNAYFRYTEVHTDPETSAFWIDLSKFEPSLESAKAIFKAYTEDMKLEGIVIKPMTPTPASPPYMKVRSGEYLRLVYGYDYTTPSRLKSLCDQKRVGRKTSVSISEANLGREMLNCSSESDMKLLIAKMIGEMKVEKELDPRL